MDGISGWGGWIGLLLSYLGKDSDNVLEEHDQGQGGRGTQGGVGALEEGGEQGAVGGRGLGHGLGRHRLLGGLGIVLWWWLCGVMSRGKGVGGFERALGGKGKGRQGKGRGFQVLVMGWVDGTRTHSKWS